MDNLQYTYPSSPQMPPPPAPMGRRAKWEKRLMSGAAVMMNSLPGWFASYALVTYLIAVLGVSLVNSNYAMEWYFWVFGIAWVAGFFYLSAKFSRDWSIKRIRKQKGFEKRLFWTGFAIRTAYVIFIYIFYLEMTGEAHEFSAADSKSYMELATDWSIYWGEGGLGPVLAEQAKTSFSDMGFPLFILLPIRWFGADASLIIIRLLNALLGSYTAVLIYRLVARSMDETTARFAGIFCMLHPVFVCYCGIILKEVLMTFLLVVFIDLGDKLFRNKRYTFGTIAPLMLVGLSLFMFRTVLGMIAFMAIFFALVMMDTRIVSFRKKFILGILVVGILLLSASDNIMNEIHQITDADVRGQQETSMTMRYGEKKGGKEVGNVFAKYAGAAVFAPLIFTIPFPTMVQAGGQEDMRLIHGGNWMRNVMSGLVVLAMFMLLLTGDWRKYTLPLAMLLGYLLMLSFTQFAHSLRFHIPVMPFEMMFAAYALTNFRKKHRVWYLVWCLFMVVACFIWNWFKLAGRGMT